MDIIERVRRLLALSQSSNVHEAASAAAKAQELIAKHQLDVAELAESGNAPDEPVGAADLLALGGRSEPWKEIIVNALSRANGCRAWLSVIKPKGGRRHQAMRILGTASNVGVVRYMLAYLIREVERLVKSAAREAGIARGLGMARVSVGRTFYGSFRLGAATSIATRINAAAELARAEAQASATPGALVRIDRGAARVAEAYAELDISKGRSRARFSHTVAFLAGVLAGEGVALGSGPALGAGACGALR